MARVTVIVVKVLVGCRFARTTTCLRFRPKWLPSPAGRPAALFAHVPLPPWPSPFTPLLDILETRLDGVDDDIGGLGESNPA